MADSDPDVRWMSYAEAARALRVTPESLHRRMRRNGWARREGNDGKPRVAVPVNVLERFGPVQDDAPDVASDDVQDTSDESRMIRALEGEAAALREALGRERERADKAEAEVAAERARTAQAEREREAAKVAAASAEGEARGLRDVLAEARRPFWRRWVG